MWVQLGGASIRELHPLNTPPPPRISPFSQYCSTDTGEHWEEFLGGVCGVCSISPASLSPSGLRWRWSQNPAVWPRLGPSHLGDSAMGQPWGRCGAGPPPSPVLASAGHQGVGLGLASKLGTTRTCVAVASCVCRNQCDEAPEMASPHPVLASCCHPPCPALMVSGDTAEPAAITAPVGVTYPWGHAGGEG